MIVVLGIGPGNENYRLQGMTQYCDWFKTAINDNSCSSC